MAVAAYERFVCLFDLDSAEQKVIDVGYGAIGSLSMVVCDGRPILLILVACETKGKARLITYDAEQKKLRSEYLPPGVIFPNRAVLVGSELLFFCVNSHNLLII